MSQASEDMRTAIEDIIRGSGEAERLRGMLKLKQDEVRELRRQLYASVYTEREACVGVCEEVYKESEHVIAMICSRRIRDRTIDEGTM